MDLITVFCVILFTDKIVLQALGHKSNSQPIAPNIWIWKLKEIDNWNIFILEWNSYCCPKKSAKDLGLKSHPKDYHQRLTH